MASIYESFSIQNVSTKGPLTLSCISKVMERIMFKHMHNFLHDRNILNKYQSGFQPGDSTVNQYIYDHICQGLENKKFVCMFLVTFRKHSIESGMTALSLRRRDKVLEVGY